MGERSGICGLWEVYAPQAPFPHHLFLFHPDRTFVQTNPDGGNATSSDSAGLGIWRPLDEHTVIGTFVEFSVDRGDAGDISKTVVEIRVEVRDATFTGTAVTTSYSPAGALRPGPARTTLSGVQVVLPEPAAPTDR